ncbi:unnamed protein product, partial [Closterium sp. NIES-53]
MVADGDALINLAHNFFFGDAVLFAAGCQVCPVHISKPNNLVMGDTFDVLAGKCNDVADTALQYISVAGAGKESRVSLSGNCLTLSPDVECSSNTTQRSTAACQAFCSITDNGPCDGHGECMPPAPASPSNFTCLCNAGYSSLDLGNGSTCAIVHSTTTTGEPAWRIHTVSFLYFQMVKATNNWSDDNMLGKGDFGIVYKGHSPHGQLWAIKRSTVMTNGFETECSPSLTDVQVPAFHVCICLVCCLQVRAMASLHHLHLIRLLGFCLDQNVETGKQKQILVYEFVGNRDMEYHIQSTKRPLSLRQRLRLAQGSAEGLAYLHGFETPIVHRNIKPANILVTADMHAKVADFGLLKRITHGDADSTRVAGTPGYVDPDYNRTNIITAKSDVFSFGIVLLELLTGKSPQIDAKSHIRKWAMKMVEAYELDQLKDSKLSAVSEEAIVDFADLALDFIKSPGTRRPSMKDVAYRLSALIEKHCPNKEEEWEGTGKEASTSTGELSSENVFAVSFGGGGMDSQQSQ